MIRRFALAAPALLAPLPVMAATLTATPETFAAVYAKAACGDTIKLGEGEYSSGRIRGKTCPGKPLVIDAGKARIGFWWFSAPNGLTIRGGTLGGELVTTRTIWGAIRADKAEGLTVERGDFVGPPGPRPSGAGPGGIGVFVNGGSKVTVTDSTFTGLDRGVVLNRVGDFRITGNQFVRQRSDGVNIGPGWRGLVADNECRGTTILDIEHPDCVQLWSKPDSEPTSDIVIQGNRVRGATQGLTLFNHVKKGVDDGGFDRITIEDNELEVTYPHAIALYDCRDCTVARNRVRTMPGGAPARSSPTGRRDYQANINVFRGEVSRCGNTIASAAGRRALKDPACRNAQAPGGRVSGETS